MADNPNKKKQTARELVNNPMSRLTNAKKRLISLVQKVKHRLRLKANLKNDGIDYEGVG